MRPLRLRIQEAARQYGVPQNLIEKDYALTYTLAGLAFHPDLADTLLFKGGTALKKVFFGDYRFSEDLDFSAQSAPKDRELESAIHQAVQHTADLLSAQGPFSVETARRPEQEPHPGGQDAFVVRVQFPWHPRPLCQIKVEITHDELVVLAPTKRTLIHGYGEDLRPRVTCYQLEEIVAEKLRALLQTHQNMALRDRQEPSMRGSLRLATFPTRSYEASRHPPRAMRRSNAVSILSLLWLSPRRRHSRITRRT